MKNRKRVRSYIVCILALLLPLILASCAPLTDGALDSTPAASVTDRRTLPSPDSEPASKPSSNPESDSDPSSEPSSKPVTDSEPASVDDDPASDDIFDHKKGI